MKETTKMSRAVSQLEHIYNALNTDFFDGLLPVPIITVQSKPGTYGHCTTAKVWQRKDGGAYELNIAAEVLNYPIEETLDISKRQKQRASITLRSLGSIRSATLCFRSSP